MKRISIITITYNAEATIAETMLSVLEQKYRPLQYILIDGGSTDRTNEMISELMPRFEAAGIDVIAISEPDEGISDAFNKGIGYATGDVIGIINAGDSYACDVLEKVMEIDWDEIDMLCGDVIWKDNDNGLEYVRRSDTNWSKLRFEMSVMHPSCFVKSSTYIECGVFDVSFKYAMDYDLVCRFYRKNRNIKYLPLVIANMRAGGTSDTDIVKIKSEILRINQANHLHKCVSELHWWWLKFRYGLASRLKKSGLFIKSYNKELFERI